MPFSRRTDPNFLPAAGNVRAFVFKRHFSLQNVICWYHIMFKAGFQPCSGPFSVFHVKHVSRETGKRPPHGGLFPYQPGKAVYAKPSDPPHTGPKGGGGRGKGKQKWKRKALPSAVGGQQNICRGGRSGALKALYAGFWHGASSGQDSRTGLRGVFCLYLPGLGDPHHIFNVVLMVLLVGGHVYAGALHGRDRALHGIEK